MEKAIAFQIGPLAIHWYSLCILTGIILAYLVTARRINKIGENPDHLYNIASLGIFFGILCARLYYVAFNWSYYKEHPGSILAVWEGGLAIHGAIIAAVLTTYFYTRSQKVSFWKWADICSPGLLLGQAMGRWGNYFNQEAFGYPTNLPWGIYIKPENRPLEYANYSHFHPTFFYEFLWDMLVFTFLLWYTKRQEKKGYKHHGNVFLLYGVLYSIGRFFVEGLRTDSLMFGPLRAAQLFTLFFIIISAVLLFKANWRPTVAETKITNIIDDKKAATSRKAKNLSK